MDIRVAVYKNTFHVYHGFYGHTLTSVFRQVKTFLETNTKEVVFLGMNRCLDCTPDDITKLGQVISDTFSEKIFAMPSTDPFKTTLNNVWNAGKQMIVFYDTPGQSFPFWPHDSVNAPHYDALTPDLLIPGLDGMTIVPDKFNNYQAVVSPDQAYVLANQDSSLKKLAEIANPEVADWLDGMIERCNAGLSANQKLTMLWIDFVGDVNEIESRVVWLNKVKRPDGCALTTATTQRVTTTMKPTTAATTPTKVTTAATSTESVTTTRPASQTNNTAVKTEIHTSSSTKQKVTTIAQASSTTKQTVTTAISTLTSTKQASTTTKTQTGTTTKKPSTTVKSQASTTTKKPSTTAKSQASSTTKKPSTTAKIQAITTTKKAATTAEIQAVTTTKVITTTTTTTLEEVCKNSTIDCGAECCNADGMGGVADKSVNISMICTKDSLTRFLRVTEHCSMLCDSSDCKISAAISLHYNPILLFLVFVALLFQSCSWLD